MSTQECRRVEGCEVCVKAEAASPLSDPSDLDVITYLTCTRTSMLGRTSCFESCKMHTFRYILLTHRHLRL